MAPSNRSQSLKLRGHLPVQGSNLSPGFKVPCASYTNWQKGLDYVAFLGAPLFNVRCANGRSAPMARQETLTTATRAKKSVMANSLKIGSPSADKSVVGRRLLICVAGSLEVIVGSTRTEGSIIAPAARAVVTHMVSMESGWLGVVAVK